MLYLQTFEAFKLKKKKKIKKDWITSQTFYSV